MYLALTIACAGLAVAMNLVWPLLFLVVPVWVMSSKVIPYEEANLERLFGEQYLAYRKRVRRWI